MRAKHLAARFMFAEMPHVWRHGLIAHVHAVMVLVVRMLRLPCCTMHHRQLDNWHFTLGRLDDTLLVNWEGHTTAQDSHGYLRDAARWRPR